MIKLFDARDEEERSEIAEVLKELPEEHPARRAYREGADAIRLTHLVDGRKDLIEGLTNAWLGGYRRMLLQHGHFRPGRPKN